jgi:hypothetical protein
MSQMDVRPANILDLVEEIARLPGDWHGAGTVSRNVLRAIASHAERMGAIHHSVETGSGRPRSCSRICQLTTLSLQWTRVSQ